MGVLIVDNFLKNADWLSEFAKCLDYKKRSTDEFFEGERSPELHSVRKAMSTAICRNIIEKYYGVKDFSYKADLYFHKTCEKDLKDTQWVNDRIHRDIGKTAAIIFLSKEAPLNCGTQTYTEENEPDIIMGNKYNRLIMYPCETKHSAVNYFSNKDQNRLVLLFWLYELDIQE